MSESNYPFPFFGLRIEDSRSQENGLFGGAIKGPISELFDGSMHPTFTGR